MKQHYVMPVGVDDFRQVREKYYYVDKTDFIRTLIDGHAAATLITRPRRFGKTLAMSMLYYFFTMKEAERNRALFEGTEVEAAGERYMAEQGTKPVVFISLKDIKQPHYKGMVEMFGSAMQDIYYEFVYLMEGDVLPPHEKKYFQSVLDKTASEVDLQLSLKKLTVFLARYHQKSVLVLIDEYDSPIQAAWDNDYYPAAINFMRNYLSSVLKSNPHLDFAVLTGVLRIAKESIFSSLNNLKVASVAAGGLEEVMGFTHAEIEQMAKDFGVPEKYEEIKTWYDGYNFSGKEIYNPWSVVSYFENNCQAAAYWVNTSGNSILRQLLENATTAQTEELTGLLHGNTVSAELMEGIIYSDISENSDALYSMLLNTGYLTMVDYPDPYTGDDGTMRIPNWEIRTLFKKEVMRHLSGIGSDSKMLKKLLSSLLAGNAADFEEKLSGFLQAMASFYDTGAKESFYHGLVLGLLATLMPRFEVLSNRESGYGRFDIAIFPGKNQTAGALLEFKVAESEADMPQRAKEALAQIKENDYAAEFQRRGISEPWKYGIAFCGKKCHIERKV
ncbi:AAA family ATPase [Selenomonas sp. KH1T6]|uniref:AAA family ATPase n=1 Tax=Selenomonas sp. KH1T6 TaxID=3158784 RepID=UPI0008A7D72C|nr:PD-(D/E)XK nuclease superfamily protein [Selenomonas ruminantium]